MEFRIEQNVRVYPKTWCLRRYNGWLGSVDTIEREDDGQWVYRVKLLDEPGQGFPYYAHELKSLDDVQALDAGDKCPPEPGTQ